MAPFRARIGRKWMRKVENKNYRFVPFLPSAEQKILKKRQKIKKIKNSIMASSQANIVWKRPRKRENKNYRFASFLADALWKIQKKQQ